MKRPRGERERLSRRFDAAIRRAGVKRTPQRIEIFREVARTADHPDIERIFRNVRKKMPAVSLDTVYRTLGLFAELGLVTTVRPLHHRLCFDANTSAHHHFVCARCGTIFDFEHRDFDVLDVPEAAAALGRVDSRHVELRGLCASCASRHPKALDLHPGFRERGTPSPRPGKSSSRRDRDG